MYGDLLIERLVGIGGGGISERFSGETDAFSSDPSVEAAGKGSSPCSLACRFLSSTSLSTCDTMAGLGPVFRLNGLEIGELLTLGLLLVLAACVFLVFFERSKLTAGITSGSRSISIGELFE
jgi:hypothetical protein